MSEVPDLKDIEKAHELIGKLVNKTPISLSAQASNLLGHSVYFKYENLQRTGSFKIRGALNKILHLSAKEKSQGVICSSAGNHAQGVALASQISEIPATIVMPETSPLVKINSTKSYGAEVILHGTIYDAAFLEAKRLAKEKNLVFIPPFEDKFVIAGQGTIGLEMLAEVKDLTKVFIPVGGGGLAAGVSIALRKLNPKIKIIGVAAQGAPNMALSFQAGKLVKGEEKISTIADGLAVKTPSSFMLDILKKNLDDLVIVSDDEIADAIVFVMEKTKTLVEGAGAVGLAALMHHKVKTSKSDNSAVILSGGNIDLATVDRVILKGLEASGRMARILVSVPDVPGTLTGFTKVIAENRANIVHILHNRYGHEVHLREVVIEFVLETNGPAHVQEIKKSFQKLGARVLS